MPGDIGRRPPGVPSYGMVGLNQEVSKANMGLYWFPSRLPELKDVPRHLQEEIVEEALYSIPISLSGLLSSAAVAIPLVIVAAALIASDFGPWSKGFFYLAALPLVWVWWLNTARSRIRELAQGITGEESERRTGDRT